MWIIPKHSSMYRSAQDMGALISDSQELSEHCEQSLLWRSKPSQSSTWLRRLKPGTLMSALSTQTLKPPLGSSIVGEWIFSQEAFLVSHLAQPVDEQETATLDTCGPTLPMGLDEWGTLPLFSWKTSRVSSAPNSKAQSGQTQKGRPFCSMSLENWSAWVTKQRREYSQRAKSVRPISASGSLSWVVAPISARQGEGLLMGCSETQREGKQWATILVGASKAPMGGGDPSKENHMSGIENQVQVTHGPHQEAQSSTLGSRQGYLNPRWVETLMGLPVGWTMPSCATPWTIEQTSLGCLEMELSLPQQSELLEPSGNHWPTPPASQRGDTVEVYERHAQKREAQGLARFSPTLKVAVLMEHNCDE